MFADEYATIYIVRGKSHPVLAQINHKITINKIDTFLIAESYLKVMVPAGTVAIQDHYTALNFNLGNIFNTAINAASVGVDAANNTNSIQNSNTNNGNSNVTITTNSGTTKQMTGGNMYERINLMTALTIDTEAGKEYYVFVNEQPSSTKLRLVTKEKELKKLIAKRDNYFCLASYTVTDIPSQEYIVQQSSLQAKSSTNNPIVTAKRILSDVDKDIPITKQKQENTYALIIANEEYQFVDNVNYASYDGETFKEYCIKTLGIPERQVRYCSNASYGIISGAVDWLSYALNNFEGSRAIVYYCGHGIPDEKTGEAFIVPVDGKGTNTTTCYSLNTLYKTLAATKATSITYFMDACFTGANKEGSMLVAARGVAREPKKETIAGNAVVFSASSGDETAMTYEEKQHGLFTYYLLKKLQETSGNVTYNELADYISKNVKKDAFLLNEKPQTPVVATSPAVSSSWKNMKL